MTDIEKLANAPTFADWFANPLFRAALFLIVPLVLPGCTIIFLVASMIEGTVLPVLVTLAGIIWLFGGGLLIAAMLQTVSEEARHYALKRLLLEEKAQAKETDKRKASTSQYMKEL